MWQNIDWLCTAQGIIAIICNNFWWCITVKILNHNAVYLKLTWYCNDQLYLSK